MPKIKNIIFPAAFGFVLSFLISVLVTRNFLSSLLRGFVFALVFAALAMLIDLVYGRFLDDGSTPEVSPASGGKPEAKTGNYVDLTVGDAELTEDGDNLRFAVNNNVVKIPDADTKDTHKAEPSPAAAPASNAGAAAAAVPVMPQRSAPAETSAAPAGGAASPAQAAPAAEAEMPAFQPITLGKPLPKEEKGSGSEMGKKEKAAARRAERAAEKREIDALPDLDSFGDEDLGSDGDDDIIEDSEFAEDGSGRSSGSRLVVADGNKAKDHDTETLAKAIRTILKKDE